MEVAVKKFEWEVSVKKIYKVYVKLLVDFYKLLVKLRQSFKLLRTHVEQAFMELSQDSW